MVMSDKDRMVMEEQGNEINVPKRRERYYFRKVGAWDGSA